MRFRAGARFCGICFRVKAGSFFYTIGNFISYRIKKDAPLRIQASGRRNPVLQVKDLTIVHKKDLREIAKGFRLCLNPGDKAVIVGEEGNGKSTLLKWIYDPGLIEGYAEAAGDRICEGERLGYLPQELPEREREKTVYEYFSAQPAFWEQTPKELAVLAGQLGLEPEFFYGDQRMESLSGGEKVKAQMASLLLGQPTALLLDEPSNDIDIETLEWLEELIQNWKGPVLFVSHDETLIERTANVIVHMEQLKRKTESRCSVVRLPYREYLKRRQESMENQEQQAENERREEKKRQEKFRRMQQKVENELRSVSRQDPHGGYLLKKKMKAVKSLERRYERESREMTELPETEEAIFFKLGEGVKMPAGKTVLELETLELRAPGDGGILARNVSLRVRGGQKVCIIGKNGAGKTTLIRWIAGQLLARDDIRAAYMPQNYEEMLDRDETPVDYLDRTGEKEERTRIRTYLGSLKFTAGEMDHPIRELSGGQKAKVLLLKMSLSGADVLILDEPTRNFSPLSGPVIRRMLKEYKGAVISVSHDRKYIEEVCDAVFRLTPEGLVPDAGEIAATAPGTRRRRQPARKDIG